MILDHRLGPHPSRWLTRLVFGAVRQSLRGLRPCRRDATGRRWSSAAAKARVTFRYVPQIVHRTGLDTAGGASGLHRAGASTRPAARLPETFLPRGWAGARLLPSWCVQLLVFFRHLECAVRPRSATASGRFAAAPTAVVEDRWFFGIGRLYRTCLAMDVDSRDPQRFSARSRASPAPDTQLYRQRGHGPRVAWFVGVLANALARGTAVGTGVLARHVSTPISPPPGVGTGVWSPNDRQQGPSSRCESEMAAPCRPLLGGGQRQATTGRRNHHLAGAGAADVGRAAGVLWATRDDPVQWGR